MGLLEEPEAAGDDERDAVLRQLHLHIHGLKVRAVQDGHFVPCDSFILMKIFQALADKGRLHGRRVQPDERWFHAQ